MPKVSVVIPCYNQAKYINDAVDSVLAQTYEDYEILIVNDGSTDEFTNRLLEDYRRPKTGVILTKNQGVSTARNLGIKASSGVYILPLDADDLIDKEYLSKAVAVLDNDQEIGIVSCLFSFFGSINYRPELQPFRPELMLVRNELPSASLFRRTDWERSGGYNPAMKQGWEDWDFWLSLIESGVGVYRIPEVLFRYRILQGSRERSMTKEHKVQMYTKLYHNHPIFFSRNIDVVFRELCDYQELVGSRSYTLMNFVTDPRLLLEKTLKKLLKQTRDRKTQAKSP